MTVLDFNIEARKPYADGQTFGDNGAYEQIDGKITFAVEPLDPCNQGIVDLHLAPRDDNGRVRFTSDISLIAPLAPRQAHGKLLVDIPTASGRRIGITRPGRSLCRIHPFLLQEPGRTGESGRPPLVY